MQHVDWNYWRLSY